MSALSELSPVTLEPGISDGAHVTEFATPRVRRNRRMQLTLVAPLRPERASRGTFVLVLVGVLGLALLGMLVINTSLAQGSFAVQALKGQHQALLEQEQALLEEVAAAGAPIGLEYRARQLGMVASQTPVFITVPDGRVLGKVRPAPGSASQTAARITAPEGFTAAISELPTTLAASQGLPQAQAALTGEDMLWRELAPASLRIPGAPLVASAEVGIDDQLMGELVAR